MAVDVHRHGTERTRRHTWTQHGPTRFGAAGRVDPTARGLRRGALAMSVPPARMAPSRCPGFRSPPIHEHPTDVSVSSDNPGWPPRTLLAWTDAPAGFAPGRGPGPRPLRLCGEPGQ